jgi:hypothetical protein
VPVGLPIGYRQLAPVVHPCAPAVDGSLTTPANSIVPVGTSWIATPKGRSTVIWNVSLIAAGVHADRRVAARRARQVAARRPQQGRADVASSSPDSGAIDHVLG